MDPFEGFDRLDFFIEPVFNENSLEGFVEDLFQQAGLFQSASSHLEKFDDFRAL